MREKVGSRRMDRFARIAIPGLIVAAVVCGVAATALHSEVFGVTAATFAAMIVFVVISAVSTNTDVRRTSARSTAYGPTSSATVDVIEIVRPAPAESPDASFERTHPSDSGAPGAMRPPDPPAPVFVSAPAPAPVAAPAPESEPTPDPAPAAAPAPSTPLATVATTASAPVLVFSPKLPAGSEPREVIQSLLVAARAAGHPIAAHLWLEDPATDTLRLVEAQGEARPTSVPVSVASGLLGSALGEGTAHLGPIEHSVAGEEHTRRWRYALPLDGSNVRGVAAIDFEGEEQPDGSVLTTVSATLRASLSGALALFVARNEAETARALVATCSALSKVLDPADVLRTALEHAMEIAGAQTGSIMLLDPDTRRMRIAVSSGLPEDIVVQTDISEGDGIAGWVLASRQPLVIEDLKESGIRSRRHGIRSAVCVPLADDQGIVGVLNVGCTEFHARFSKSHLETLSALGCTIVLALRSAWASEGAQNVYFDTLKTLAVALESRDPYSRGATQRVVELVDALGRYFDVPHDEMKALRIAAMLHDVGMSAAGNVVPVTDGPLSTVEWGMLKMHPVIASEIMSQAPALKDVIPIVYHHHEHYDGHGYVAGLSGPDIPLGARILAVVDAYVAMTSGRPYRPALTHEQAVGELQRLSGTQFDPRIVRAMVEVLGAGEPGAGFSS